MRQTQPDTSCEDFNAPADSRPYRRTELGLERRLDYYEAFLLTKAIVESAIALLEARPDAARNRSDLATENWGRLYELRGEARRLDEMRQEFDRNDVAVYFFSVPALYRLTEIGATMLALNPDTTSDGSIDDLYRDAVGIFADAHAYA